MIGDCSLSNKDGQKIEQFYTLGLSRGPWLRCHGAVELHYDACSLGGAEEEFRRLEINRRA